MDFDDHSSRDKKIKIAVAIGGGLLLIGAITACAIVLSGDSSKTVVDGGSGQASGSGSANPVTFDQYLNGEFSYKSYRGTWWDDTKLQTKDENGNLVTYDVVTNKTEILVSAEQIAGIGEKAVFRAFAPNNPALQLYSYDSESIWRYSSLARYAVYNSDTEVTYEIVPTGHTSADNKLNIAEWMPHPTEDKVIFVFENDIYIRANYMDQDNDLAVSTDGELVEAYNGIPDWVYEEEIMATNKAMYYSESGEYVAYAHFDDTGVETFSWQIYGDHNDPEGHRYPVDNPIKYPKAGMENPTLELRVYDVVNDVTGNVILPAGIADFDFGGEYLYSAAKFISNTKLSIIWMNRVQNTCIVSECTKNNAGNHWTCSEVDLLDEPNGWLDLFQPPLYNDNGDAYLQIQTNPTPVNDRHYRHLAKMTTGLVGGGTKTFLTSGVYVVTSVNAWDVDHGIVYYTATAKNGPGERHFYKVSDAGGATETCITCQLDMPTSGEPCLYSSISMSPGYDYYIQTCLGPNIPETVLRSTTDNSIMENLEDNAQLAVDLVGTDIPTRLYDNFTMDNGFSAKVKMVLPINYDPSGATKYATIVDVYGGPESQDVTYRYGVGTWADFMVTNHDIVYISIDGRGTAYQSNEMMFEVYRNLGSAEIEDQIEVMKILTSMYPFIDPLRRGIWGWSYGGYATTMTMIKDVDNVFSCGIAVAPPTSWYFYDTVYTERYMGTPFVNDNHVGFDDSSVLNKVKAMRGKKYMLNHGTADDNVHYQNSMMLVKALEKEDIQFDQRSYPDENHGLGGESRFLYHGFDIFWGECFSYVSNIPAPATEATV